MNETVFHWTANEQYIIPCIQFTTHEISFVADDVIDLIEQVVHLSSTHT